MSAQASAYAALYLAIVTDALNDTSYHAYLAELDYGLSGGRFGVHVRSIAGCEAGRYRRCAPHTPCRVCLLLQLSFSGFTEKMPRLAESVMTRLASGEVLEDRFVVVQEQVLRGYVAPTLARWQWLCGEVVVHTRILRLLVVFCFHRARNRLISATRHSAYQRLLCLRSKSVEQPAFVRHRVCSV